MFKGSFKSWSDVSKEFTGQSFLDKGITAIPKPDEVIFAGYDRDGYDGSAFVIYRQGNDYFTAEGSHCSCYGLEDQWNPEAYTLPMLIEALEKRTWWRGMFADHRKQIMRALRGRL